MRLQGCSWGLSEKWHQLISQEEVMLAKEEEIYMLLLNMMQQQHQANQDVINHSDTPMIPFFAQAGHTCPRPRVLLLIGLKISRSA